VKDTGAPHSSDNLGLLPALGLWLRRKGTSIGSRGLGYTRLASDRLPGGCKERIDPPTGKRKSVEGGGTGGWGGCGRGTEGKISRESISSRINPSQS